MRYLKITVLAGVLGAVVGMPVFADESPVMPKSIQPLSETDVSLIFEADAEPMQLAALSPQGRYGTTLLAEGGARLVAV